MKNKNQINKSLLKFAWFAEGDMQIYMENALTLKDLVIKGKCNDYTINFMANLAAAHIIETLILEIFETWIQLDKVLKGLGEKHLTKNKDYYDLKDMRNKLVGHRLETSISSPKYIAWYKKEYGSLEKTFKLLQKIALTLSKKIDTLENEGKIDAPIQPRKIKRIQIKEILNKLNT